ncbi:LOW QUALITY PROTEIN: diacylglycerol kinase [Psychrobacter sp. JCM 18903]|uniref:diacylglycerol kinase n=1 Tax=Psychrobacter sp. JCM 18903 TaxID=1298610 RepID=UPI000435DC24|nr:diacylglycerol kinase [Psychrobacter sp. JCM 18903]GAF62499.1 LOW QUALITY PROTEIN: diacylglycerol kinase [Psychrobacter sp. JCM 18903]
MNKANPINLENQSASRGVLSPIAGKKQLLPHSYASDAKGKTGFYRIIKAAGYSLDGFKAAYKFEAAFRQVFWLNLILFMAIILCPFTISIKMLLVVASFVSLIVELINTGIEASVDHTSTAKHPLAKIAKDVGSAAQFLALLLLFILWMMALLSVVF